MRASQLHARASYTRLPPRATLSRWWSKVSNRMAGSSEPWRNPQHFSRARWDANTVAVVTGANKGIGKECVRQLAAQGVTVVATARSTQNGEAAVAEVADGNRVLFHQVCRMRRVCVLARPLTRSAAGLDRRGECGGARRVVGAHLPGRH